MGASDMRIMLRHILPNVVAPIIVLASLILGIAILIEASLSFLGLGVQAPTPAWGSMLNQSAQGYFETHPHMALIPGAAISLAVFAFNLFGDALRDVLDPGFEVREANGMRAGRQRRPSHLSRPYRLGHRLALRVQVPFFPGAVLRPDEGRLHRGAGVLRGFEHAERDVENGALLLYIKGVTAGIAQREVGEDEPGHAHVFHNVLRAPDDDGRNAVCFQVPGDQTHGLVADGSDTGYDRDINTVLPAHGQDLGRVALNRLALAAGGGGTVEARGDAANAAGCDRM